MPCDFSVGNGFHFFNFSNFFNQSKSNKKSFNVKSTQPRATLNFKNQVSGYGQDIHGLLNTIAQINRSENASRIKIKESSEILAAKIKENLEALTAQAADSENCVVIEKNLEENLKYLFTQAVNILYSKENEGENNWSKYTQALLNNVREFNTHITLPSLGEKCTAYIALLETIIQPGLKTLSEFRAIPFWLIAWGGNVDDIMQIFRLDKLPEDKATAVRDMLNYIGVFSLKIEGLNNKEDIAECIKKQGFTCYTEVLDWLRKSRLIESTLVHHDDKKWLTGIAFKMRNHGNRLTCNLREAPNQDRIKDFLVAGLDTTISLAAAVVSLSMLILGIAIIIASSPGTGSVAALLVFYGTITLGIAFGWGIPAFCDWKEYFRNVENTQCNQLKKQGIPANKTLNLQEIYNARINSRVV